MAAIPPRPEQEIIDRVYKSYEAAESDELYLGRLGASSIGEDCLRAVWLKWRAYQKAAFSGRMLRLFGTGHWQEARVVVDLKNAGLQVWEVDPSTGQQVEYTDPTGHFIVKLDGVVKGVPGCVEKAHTLEIKTHNKNSFSGVQKHGVAKSKPTHEVQMQAGMWLSGMSRCLYVSVCKDDEQFYVERVKEDKPTQHAIEKKIIKLVEAKLRPARINEDVDSFACKFCDVKEVCFNKVEPLKTCRSCRCSTAIAGGEWYCEMHEKNLTKDEQRAACSEYEVL